MSPIAIATDQDLLCTRCDTRNTGDALFCVGCGASIQTAASALPPAQPIPARPAHCANCGNANPVRAAFCVTCGASLSSGATVGYQPAFAGAGGTFVQQIYIAAPPTPEELPLGIRALWFVFVGLWAGQAWLLVAWLLNLTLIGLPAGLWMLNQLPQVMTLRQQRHGLQMQAGRSNVPFVARAIYFVLVGWWLSLLWIELAWLASALLIGLPLSFLMFERTGTVATLADS
ncbi:MAG: zinc ribbon domain-containing protein [Chloroflexota bacterium]|nr:zinc ribbon domain-containing protein [Chloroflexota bacterium]